MGKAGESAGKEPLLRARVPVRLRGPESPFCHRLGVAAILGKLFPQLEPLFLHLKNKASDRTHLTVLS